MAGPGYQGGVGRLGWREKRGRQGEEWRDGEDGEGLSGHSVIVGWWIGFAAAM